MKIFYYLIVLLLSFVFITNFCFSQDSGGIFPLWKSLAKGKELPSPFGFGLNVYTQDQTFNFSESSFYVSDLNLDTVIPQDLDINNQITERNFKVDLWVLPFVNVFGLLGEINGETIVDYELLDQQIQMNYKGIIYGSGVTMAGGYEPYFISLTAAFSNTRLDNSESSAKAWIFTPKVGLVMNGWKIIKDLNIWLGAMYQKTEEQHSGSLSLFNSIDVQYDVTLQQKSAWNSMAGVMISFSGDLCLELERGIGDRKHTLASLIYRI
ncbi:MAG: hypothetical protein R6V04_13235 [bacterium]